MENYTGTTINKLFIKDGKPFITSSNIQYELGSKTSNPEFKIEDNYMINGKDVLQILPKLSSDITLCMTTTNDGEKVGYDVIIDTGKSIVSTIDTRGNHSTLTSLEDDWKIKTNKTIHLETEDVFIDASRDIFVKAGRDIITNAGRDIITKAGRDIIFDAGRFYGMSSPAFKTNAKGSGGTFTLEAPNGIVKIDNYSTQSNDYSLNSSAGTFISTGAGYNFSKLITAPDLKVNAFNSANAHYHDHPMGPTKAPMG